MKKLSLFMRVGCHLCEDIEQQLLGLAQELDFEIDAIDIDADPALVEEFGARVPVLRLGKRFICDYFLDEHALRDALAEHEDNEEHP